MFLEGQKNLSYFNGLSPTPFPKVVVYKQLSSIYVVLKFHRERGIRKKIFEKALYGEDNEKKVEKQYSRILRISDSWKPRESGIVWSSFSVSSPPNLNCNPVGSYSPSRINLGCVQPEDLLSAKDWYELQCLCF